MSTRTRVVIHPAAIKAAREAAAYGLLSFGFAVEGAWKRDAVVRGGHRSFMTGPKTKAGTPKIGGTFRRSIHTVAYLDGVRIGAGTATSPNSGVDGNKEPVPDYVPERGAVVFVGSNSGYGAFVELGTSRMPARPAAVPALLRLKGQAPALIAAGARKHLGQSASGMPGPTAGRDTGADVFNTVLRGGNPFKDLGR
jgi:hypothetical protein